jgi:hypothetical protein
MTPDEVKFIRDASRQMRFWREGQTRAGLMHDLAEYRASLKTTPRPDPKDWARILLSQIADGKVLPIICGNMAREALHVSEEVE